MAKRYGRPVRRALCPLLVLLAFLSGLLLLPGQALASDRSIATQPGAGHRLMGRPHA